MNQNDILESPEILKEKLIALFGSEKKLKALENFGLVVDLAAIEGCERFKRKVEFIRKVLLYGFLDHEEIAFLDHAIRKLNFEYLHWTHKTKRLKQKMAEMRGEKPAEPKKAPVRVHRYPKRIDRFLQQQMDGNQLTLFPAIENTRTLRK